MCVGMCESVPVDPRLSVCKGGCVGESYVKQCVCAREVGVEYAGGCVTVCEHT